MKKIFTFFLSAFVSSFLFGQNCPVLVDLNGNGHLHFDYTSGTEKMTHWNLLPASGTALTVNGTVAGTTISSVAFAKSNLTRTSTSNKHFRTDDPVLGPTGMSGATFTGTVTFNFATPLTCTYSNGILPVELISFTGEKTKNSILLSWETATEINNDYFAVERSINGRDFEQLTEISGKGNSVEQVVYAFEDEQPESATNYYRLRQVDYDGTEEFSDVITVSFKDARLDLNLYPTLVSDEVNLDLTNHENENVAINILNSTGKIVHRKVVNSDEIVTLNLEHLGLSEGMYYVNCRLSRQTVVGKFLVRK